MAGISYTEVDFSALPPMAEVLEFYTGLTARTINMQTEVPTRWLPLLPGIIRTLSEAWTAQKVMLHELNGEDPDEYLPLEAIWYGESASPGAEIAETFLEDLFSNNWFEAMNNVDPITNTSYPQTINPIDFVEDLSTLGDLRKILADLDDDTELEHIGLPALKIAVTHCPTGAVVTFTEDGL